MMGTVPVHNNSQSIEAQIRMLMQAARNLLAATDWLSAEIRWEQCMFTTTHNNQIEAQIRMSLLLLSANAQNSFNRHRGCVAQEVRALQIMQSACSIHLFEVDWDRKGA
jgi:hypothetical protein